jgi:hypothetical protein
VKYIALKNPSTLIESSTIQFFLVFLEYVVTHAEAAYRVGWNMIMNGE